MDILVVLKSDHLLLAKLFDAIKEETNRQEIFGLFEEVRRTLELHFNAEEAACYPILRKFPDFERIISRSYNDHQDIRKLIDELCNTPDTRNGIAFQNRLLELKNHVESHVIEEERDLFELVCQELDAQEREKLGDLFTLAKSKFEQLVA
jgi:hemerythrin superfamily protein